MIVPDTEPGQALPLQHCCALLAPQTALQSGQSQGLSHAPEEAPGALSGPRSPWHRQPASAGLAGPAQPAAANTGTAWCAALQDPSSGASVSKAGPRPGPSGAGQRCQTALVSECAPAPAGAVALTCAGQCRLTQRRPQIAVEGCCHGELDNIYATVRQLEAQGQPKLDLLLICGDFQVRCLQTART